jgi:hypothetical protein
MSDNTVPGEWSRGPTRCCASYRLGRPDHDPRTGHGPDCASCRQGRQPGRAIHGVRCRGGHPAVGNVLGHGLAAALATSAVLSSGVKLAGAVFLVALGVRSLWAAAWTTNVPSEPCRPAYGRPLFMARLENCPTPRPGRSSSPSSPSSSHRPALQFPVWHLDSSRRFFHGVRGSCAVHCQRRSRSRTGCYRLSRDQPRVHARRDRDEHGGAAQ